jgi:hypothetical protein
LQLVGKWDSPCTLLGHGSSGLKISQLPYCHPNNVQAITSAYAKCTSTGNAYGCASAEAAASAWAEATASAHASAVADATNVCECKNAEGFAGAWASGATGAFEAKIKVDVASKAAAAVCVKSEGPGQTATAEVATVAKCIEKKYAYVMADAQARALIKGECK